LAAVYGPAAARGMLALPDDLEAPHGVRVGGYVGPPDLHRGTRGGLTLFVNGRLVYSRALLFAVEEAYHTLLPVGRHPVALLWIEVPPDEVDVNVHPTKQEVRFLRERVVFAALQRAVRGVVASVAGVPTMGPPSVPPNPGGEAATGAEPRHPPTVGGAGGAE